MSMSIFTHVKLSDEWPRLAAVFQTKNWLTQSLEYGGQPRAVVQLIQSLTSSVSLLIHETVAIVKTRLINSESCINWLFLGAPPGIRHSYPSFLPDDPQHASTLYIVPSTSMSHHPVHTAHDAYNFRRIWSHSSTSIMINDDIKPVWLFFFPTHVR